jgi:hypothetical protein
MGFHCASEALTLTCRKDESFLQIKLPVGAWKDHFSQQSRKHTLATREVKKLVSAILAVSSQEML